MDLKKRIERDISIKAGLYGVMADQRKAKRDAVVIEKEKDMMLRRMIRNEEVNRRYKFGGKKDD